MTVSGSIYFLGRYRPAYFEADTTTQVAFLMYAAIRDIEDRQLRSWLDDRIFQGEDSLSDSITSWSADHCDRGVSFAARPHDPWLDSITAKLPPCPGLDYSVALAPIGKFDPVRTLAALVAGESIT